MLLRRRLLLYLADLMTEIYNFGSFVHEKKKRIHTIVQMVIFSLSVSLFYLTKVSFFLVFSIPAAFLLIWLVGYLIVLYIGSLRFMFGDFDVSHEYMTGWEVIARSIPLGDVYPGFDDRMRIGFKNSRMRLEESFKEEIGHDKIAIHSNSSSDSYVVYYLFESDINKLKEMNKPQAFPRDI